MFVTAEIKYWEIIGGRSDVYIIPLHTWIGNLCL